MTLVLVATPGGASSNSYATRAEGDTYHDAHYYASGWIALTGSQKDVALVMATRILDEQVEWKGSKSTSEQALRWPRSGVPERDSAGPYYDPYYGFRTIDPTIVPSWLKNATAELARNLAAEDRTAEADLLEYAQVTIGSLSLTKDQTKAKDVLPDSVRVMVSPYGYVSSRSGIGMARLVRA